MTDGDNSMMMMVAVVGSCCLFCIVIAAVVGWLWYDCKLEDLGLKCSKSDVKCPTNATRSKDKKSCTVDEGYTCTHEDGDPTYVAGDTFKKPEGIMCELAATAGPYEEPPASLMTCGTTTCTTGQVCSTDGNTCVDPPSAIDDPPAPQPEPSPGSNPSPGSVWLTGKGVFGGKYSLEHVYGNTPDRDYKKSIEDCIGLFNVDYKGWMTDYKIDAISYLEVPLAEKSMCYFYNTGRIPNFCTQFSSNNTKSAIKSTGSGSTFRETIRNQDITVDSSSDPGKTPCQPLYDKENQIKPGESGYSQICRDDGLGREWDGDKGQCARP